MNQTRREFVKSTAAAGLAGTVPLTPDHWPLTTQAPLRFRAAPIPLVRIGFVGIGGQGGSHLENLLTLEGVEIVALCDIVPEKVTAWQRRIRERGRKEPAGFTRGPRDFERMCAEQELDLVFNATPWEWHVPIILAALRNGKHSAS